MKKFNGFQHGINFGGWLSQGKYDDEHLDTFITEADFKTVADWGLDHVRIPIDYNILETDSGEYIESGFQRILNAVKLCEKYGLNVILDLHKTAGFSFYVGENEQGFFESESLQERFYKLWEQLSKRFGGFSHVAYELLNEVTEQRYSCIWNNITKECIGRIRTFSPVTPILVGSYWQNSIDSIFDLDLPYDSNIVYNFHCYDPMLFTHQSAEWVENMPTDLKVHYPAHFSEYARIQKERLPNFMQSYDDKRFTKFDSEYFKSRFFSAVKIADERGISLYCGEYGVIDRADPKDVLNWYRDISAAFDYFGIGRAAWSYKGVDFGIIEPKLDLVRDKLITLM